MAFKTRQEIAHEMGISRRTLKRWMDKAGLRVKRGLLSHEEAERIIMVLHKQRATGLFKKQKF